MEDILKGIFLGWIATTCINFIIFNDRVFSYDLAIELCEKDLPRNQTCLITAIVKEGE